MKKDKAYFDEMARVGGVKVAAILAVLNEPHPMMDREFRMSILAKAIVALLKTELPGVQLSALATLTDAARAELAIYTYDSWPCGDDR